jgi:hypothetical protein
VSTHESRWPEQTIGNQQSKPSQMKKIFFSFAAALVTLSIFILQSCVKDSYQRTYTYTYYKPVYKTTAEVRANIKSNAPQAVERPGKIYIRGSYIFLTETDRGIHVIDNSDPKQPKNIAFIDIPGTMDLAVKGNTLYADLFSDLVAIDITDPHQVHLQKTVENIFPPRYYGGYFMADSSRVIVNWEKRDTTIRQTSEVNKWLSNGEVFVLYSANPVASSGSAAVSPFGMGGSMARFTITNDRLYTVGNSNLDVFNITNAANPFNVARRNLGWSIETIYPFGNQLFVGSTSGMFVYDISNADNPVQTGQFSHVRSCDPVIADNQYAYVTLRSGTTCQGYTNQLDVLKLNGSNNPSFLKTYNLTNPFGLSKDGNYLFICDGKGGLKVFNAADPYNIVLLKTLPVGEAHDVIAFNGWALLVTDNGLYQYDYSDINNIRLLSRINLSK